MKYRQLGRTGWKVSSVSFGAWAIGGTWGPVNDAEALAALHRALDRGVNFFDTADVYGDGHSERLLARLRKESSQSFYVATKAGRRLQPHVAAGYTKSNLTSFVERSLSNLACDALDLVQLHCPPSEVYYTPEVFDVMDGLVRDGKVRHYGVSVEKVEEALKAIEFPNVKTVQIIFNILRHRPSELFFSEAVRKGVGILARVPLASGLLSGRISLSTTFHADDHRSFNRNGEAFDKGETFSGVPFPTGVAAAKRLGTFCPPGMTLAQFALRWILMHHAVSCAIPGARTPAQVDENTNAADLPPLTPASMSQVRELYESSIREHVHHRW